MPEKIEHLAQLMPSPTRDVPMSTLSSSHPSKILPTTVLYWPAPLTHPIHVIPVPIQIAPVLVICLILAVLLNCSDHAAPAWHDLIAPVAQPVLIVPVPALIIHHADSCVYHVHAALIVHHDHTYPAVHHTV